MTRAHSSNVITEVAHQRPKDGILVSSPPEGSRFWDWRGQRVRYLSSGEDEHPNGPVVVFVHGLFSNADHWRKNMAIDGCRCYALDLLGCGYSDKPPPYGAVARSISGERNRPEVAAGSKNVALQEKGGGGERRTDVPLAHPLGSGYNFYTWAEQVADFACFVLGRNADNSSHAPLQQKVVLVTNSIGSISALQAAIDCPGLVAGLFLINPNFRELHISEAPALIVPLVRLVQYCLRMFGQPVYDFLARPSMIKKILKVPYASPAAVTDELVELLLAPLLTEGSTAVAFDLMSYSAGPLPEQLLQHPAFSSNATGTCPVEVVFGAADPWTPINRVLGLTRYAAVTNVTALPGVGHCPHDEAPGLVNPMVARFVHSVTVDDKRCED